jgi:hypothetical protein
LSVKQASPRADPILGLFTPEGLLMTVVLGLAVVGLFFRWFYTQHLNSAGKLEDWGHAYVVPLISGYLIWQSRGILSRIPARPFWPALAPFSSASRF